MRLTINNDEAKVLRTWLRVALDSARTGPDCTDLWSEYSKKDPSIARKYRREVKACDKLALTVRGLLKRLTPKKLTTKTA